MNESPKGPWPPLSAAVVAGGQSRRMGQDKALVSMVPDGPSLLGLTLSRLSVLSADVFVVATDRPAYDRFEVPIYPDAVPNTGTLGGIATALERARYDYCLVVGCDMPFLQPDLLAWMASVPRDYDALVPRLPGESKQGSGMVWQTLHAIYGIGCLEPIRRRLALGNRQVIGFFRDVEVQAVSPAQISRFDPQLRTFLNVNTPEALAAARLLVEET